MSEDMKEVVEKECVGLGDYPEHTKRIYHCTRTGRPILKGEDGLYSPVRVPQTERPG
jgi:hypothetical protein